MIQNLYLSWRLQIGLLFGNNSLAYRIPMDVSILHKHVGPTQSTYNKHTLQPASISLALTISQLEAPKQRLQRLVNYSRCASRGTASVDRNKSRTCTRAEGEGFSLPLPCNAFMWPIFLHYAPLGPMGQKIPPSLPTLNIHRAIYSVYRTVLHRVCPHPFSRINEFKQRGNNKCSENNLGNLF